MTIDFGINLTDILSWIPSVLTQLWPVIGLVIGISFAFWIAGRIKSVGRPSGGRRG